MIYDFIDIAISCTNKDFIITDMQRLDLVFGMGHTLC